MKGPATPQTLSHNSLVSRLAGTGYRVGGRGDLKLASTWVPGHYAAFIEEHVKGNREQQARSLEGGIRYWQNPFLCAGFLGALLAAMWVPPRIAGEDLAFPSEQGRAGGDHACDSKQRFPGGVVSTSPFPPWATTCTPR